jgi:hypothetical protein
MNMECGDLVHPEPEGLPLSSPVAAREKFDASSYTCCVYEALPGLTFAKKQKKRRNPVTA